jgi:hypothetical protein
MLSLSQGFVYHEANLAAGTLLEHQYIGIYSYWEASKQLLSATLNPPATVTAAVAAAINDAVSLDEAALHELPNVVARTRNYELRGDVRVRALVTELNPMDTMLYAAAVRAFKIRCSYFGIAVAE